MNDKETLYKVTKIPLNKSKFSWLNRQRVRYYKNLNGPVQTFVYALYDNPIRYDVKVELVEVTSLGEIDMKSYMSRRDIKTFLIKQ